ncbi:TPA: hypothetical protein DCZ31_03690 [Patescibacteria group bacterium]|nr:hypothetical protein [Candidatus Gracilibacteria bacterium]
MEIFKTSNKRLCEVAIFSGLSSVKVWKSLFNFSVSAILIILDTVLELNNSISLLQNSCEAHFCKSSSFLLSSLPIVKALIADSTSGKVG